ARKEIVMADGLGTSGQKQKTRTRSYSGFRTKGGDRGKRPRHPFLFLVLQAESPLSGGARFCLSGVQHASLAREKERRSHREGERGKHRLTIGVDDPFMSSLHATIEKTAEGFEVTALPSRNGIQVNGVPVRSRVLEEGDILTCGS